MKNRTKIEIIHAIMFIILLAIGISMILPFIWTLSSSFKPKRDIMGYPI